MNDRFKFRFFDKKKQKMMYENSDFSDYCKDEWWGYEEQMALEALDTFDNPEHYILMQCTGLKDINGKLIYEDDIVQETSIDGIYKIGYKKCAFYLESEDHICYFHELAKAFSEKRLKLIGNIYENKELLNGTNP